MYVFSDVPTWSCYIHLKRCFDQYRHEKQSQACVSIFDCGLHVIVQILYSYIFTFCIKFQGKQEPKNMMNSYIAIP